MSTNDNSGGGGGLSLLTTKILFTIFIIIADYIFLAIPFVLNQNNLWQKILNYINTLFGGMLLAVTIASLLEDSDMELLAIFPDSKAAGSLISLFPLIKLCFIAGILISMFAPLFLGIIKKRMERTNQLKRLESKLHLSGIKTDEYLLKESDEDKKIHLPRVANYNDLETQKRIKELLERDDNDNIANKSSTFIPPPLPGNISMQAFDIEMESDDSYDGEERKPMSPIDNEDTNSTNSTNVTTTTNDVILQQSNLTIFVIISLFESFLSNVILGFQSNNRHVHVLSLLIVIGDAIQIIIIGMAIEKYVYMKQYVLELRQLYLPVALLTIAIFLSNVIGTAIGILFIIFIDIKKNIVIIVVISECLMALNAGIFLKISAIDMIYIEISKEKDTSSTIVKKTIIILFGVLIGIAITVFMRYIQQFE